MLQKKFEKKNFCGLPGEIFLTPGQTETNNFFPWPEDLRFHDVSNISKCAEPKIEVTVNTFHVNKRKKNEYMNL